METLLRRMVRRSRVTGLGLVLLLSLVLTSFALAKEASLAGGGKAIGVLVIAENINGSFGPLENNRFTVTTAVENVPNGRYDLTVSGSGKVEKADFVRDKTCTIPAKKKAAVRSKDEVTAQCTLFQVNRFGKVTGNGTHTFTDRTTRKVLTLSTH